MSLELVKKQIQSSQALIFDCDGTLLDTKSVAIRAWKAGFKAVGQTLDIDWFEENAGLSEEDIIAEYEKLHEIEIDHEKVITAMHSLFLDSLADVKDINAVVELAQHSAGHLPMAVASTGSSAIVMACLKAKNLDHLFDEIITKDNVKQGKPAPDVFLEAAHRLQVEPKHCLVFDDRPEGLESASKAGIPSVDVKTFI